MKVVVAHDNWRHVGGGEYFNAYVVKALQDNSCIVSIVSAFGFDKEKYRDLFNVDLSGVKVYSFFPRPFPMFLLYQKLIGFSTALVKAVRSEKPDVVFIDNELYKPILRYKKKAGFKIVEYIHFPYDVIVRGLGEVPSELEEYARYYFGKYSEGFWKLYFKPYRFLHKL